jgi:hypothetical protein
VSADLHSKRIHQRVLLSGSLSSVVGHTWEASKQEVLNTGINTYLGKSLEISGVSKLDL